MGFAEYVSHLASWAAQASLEFSVEIKQASRWGSPILWGMLSSVQRNRAIRLLAILRSAFESHPRTSMLIAAFVEGVNDMGYSGQGSNGFELLRVLTSEFSLRTRAEALSLRATMANKSFVLSASETTPMTLVTDVVRRLDLECAKYAKLIATLPEGVDGTGLGIPESDMLLVLLRSLPESVRSYCLHHSQGESYRSYRDAAMRWEQQQQRLFQDMYAHRMFIFPHLKKASCSRIILCLVVTVSPNGPNNVLNDSTYQKLTVTPKKNQEVDRFRSRSILNYLYGYM